MKVGLPEIMSGEFRNQISARFLEVADSGHFNRDAGALAHWATLIPVEERSEILELGRHCFLNQFGKDRDIGEDLECDLLWIIRENQERDTIVYLRQLPPFLSLLPSDPRDRVLRARPQHLKMANGSHFNPVELP